MSLVWGRLDGDSREDLAQRFGQFWIEWPLPLA